MAVVVVVAFALAVVVIDTFELRHTMEYHHKMEYHCFQMFD
jgi:hypothetical protein